MKQRLFIAINLPENLKDKIEAKLEKIRYSFTDDIRFLDRKNWHLTLIFLGYQPAELLHPIVKGMENAAGEFPQPMIELTDISYGPKDSSKRMIWINGNIATSKNLAEIKENLDEALVKEGIRFKKEHRKFQTHITLARFKSVAYDQLPPIDADLSLKFPAKSLDLMESRLSRSGADYEILQKINFKL